MRNYTKISIFMIVMAVVSSASVRNPTVPASRGQSGLVQSPSPFSVDGNRVITGNVGGGKEFRGPVPYRSTTDFGGRLPSTGIDSFLRRSAGTGYESDYLPFHSSTGTVTGMRPGSTHVYTPPSPMSRISDRVDPRRVGDAVGLERLASDQESVYAPRSQYETGRLRPMDSTIAELEDILLHDAVISQPDPKIALDKKIEQDINERLERELELDSEKLKEFKLARLDEDLEDSEQARKTDQSQDIFDRMKSRLEKLDMEEFDDLDGDEWSPEFMTERAGAEDADISEQGDSLTQDELDMIEMRARGILGNYESFAAYSDDRFNQYMASAETYLKNGEYYKADSAYKMATLYKSGDPLALIGRSHALFAAGEYISSAHYLENALRIFPEFAWADVDLVGMIGRDALEIRIEDAQEWLELSDRPHLHFILAYAYYQMNRPGPAAKHIEKAQAMDSLPAKVLHRAIIKK